MPISRRRFLFGMGGAVLALPFFEGLAPRSAKADVPAVPPFAIFFRRGNGVQQGLYNRVLDAEPERWWPTAQGYGALSAAGLAGSAIEELSAYASKMTIVRGLKHPVGTQNGHREGFIQGLTGAGVKYPNDTPDIFNCDPLGESLDNRISRELLSPDPDSLFMAIGAHDKTGVSFTNTVEADGKHHPRNGEENLLALFDRAFAPAAASAAEHALLMSRRKSVNDLVRDQLTALRNDPRLSKADLDRLNAHTQAIRDTEVALQCAIPPTMRGEVQAYQDHYDADTDWFKGHSTTEFGVAAAKIAALAVSCGLTRSVLIDLGEPQDPAAYYEVPDSPEVPGADAHVDFHAISHRQYVDGDPATNIQNAQLLHHEIDRFFLRIFKNVLDELSSPANTFSDGSTLLDKGVCVHYSDIGSGQHEITQLPYLYVGGAGGALVTGQYAAANPAAPGTGDYLVKLLNTIGAAVGCKNAAGAPLDDFNKANNGGIGGRLMHLVGA